MSGPRVRFAPSPTGYFHVGSARSALFNWFVARQSADGIFLLRIEDTDADRNREEWVDGIVAAMDWLGLYADEGPFRQSDNAAAHHEAIAHLFVGGFLYYCDCTGEQVQARKGDNKTPGYDGFCRDRELERSETTGVRFKTPVGGGTTVHDLIRGDVEFSHSVIDDFIIAKSSGAVLFALANVVDDRNDAISHVIRGEEHLPNTPKQILLWQALNEVTAISTPTPVYAHLPLLVNEQRKKLSKRKDPVATEQYRDEGYLPEAFVNYLALLGWSPRGEEEKVPVTQLIEQFRLEDVSHSPAFFDVKKLQHLNGEYIRALSVEQFIARSLPWVHPTEGEWRPSELSLPWTPEQFDMARFEAMAPLVQERIGVMSEIPAMIDFLFLPEPPMDEDAFTKSIAKDEKSRVILRALADELLTVTWDRDQLHATVQAVGERHEWNLRKTQAPVRCALTGRLVGPPLFESMELLGRDETIRRVRQAAERAS